MNRFPLSRRPHERKAGGDKGFRNEVGSGCYLIYKASIFRDAAFDRGAVSHGVGHASGMCLMWLWVQMAATTLGGGMTCAQRVVFRHGWRLSFLQPPTAALASLRAASQALSRRYCRERFGVSAEGGGQVC